MRKIALWEAKHPKTVIIAALLLLIPAFLGFIGTKVNYDILSYLPDELESVQGEQVLDKTFNTAGISIVITENMQPKQTLALKNEILTVDGVSSVIWVDTITDIGIPADILPDVLKNIFYSADGSQTMMLVRYDNTGSDDSQLRAIAQIKTLLGKNQFLSGLTVVVDDTREIAETQAPLYIAVAVILALIVMSVLMESWFQPLIILFSLGLAVIYNMGTNIFLGQISFITQCVAAVLQLGVTMDYSIFLIDRYAEEKQRFSSREDAMAEAVTVSLTALMGSSLTTVFGFLALCFMKLGLGFDIGFVMAKGVVLGILTVIFVLPAVVLLFEKQIIKYRHRSFVPDFTRLNKFTIKHKKAFALLFLLLLAPAYFIQKNIDMYVTEGNLAKLEQLLYDMQRIDTSRLQSLAQFTHLSELLELLGKFDTNIGALAQFTRDYLDMAPTFESLNRDLSSPEVQKSLDNLPNIISQLQNLVNVMHASEQMLERMTSMLGGESINKIIAFTQKLENSVSMETLTKAQQQALTERMQAWLDFGSSYDIFTQRTEKMTSTVVFVYKSESIG